MVPRCALEFRARRSGATHRGAAGIVRPPRRRPHPGRSNRRTEPSWQRRCITLARLRDPARSDVARSRRDPALATRTCPRAAPRRWRAPSDRRRRGVVRCRTGEPHLVDDAETSPIESADADDVADRVAARREPRRPDAARHRTSNARGRSVDGCCDRRAAAGRSSPDARRAVARGSGARARLGEPASDASVPRRRSTRAAALRFVRRSSSSRGCS